MARWPARQYGGLQVTVTSNDGNDLTLTLWSAPRVIKGPFMSDSSMYVRHDDTWAKVHNGDFGSSVGSVFVSPSGDRAFVERKFEGGRSGGILVNLQDGNMKDQSRSPDLEGWQQRNWHSRFEQLNRGQLHQRLLSGKAEDVATAKYEIEVRTITSADLPVIAAAFVDSRLPDDLRHRLVFRLTRYEGDVPEAVLATIAQGLYDKSPRLNLSAAYALGEIADDAPESVDILTGGSAVRRRRKHDRYVPVYRDWWKTRDRSAEGR